MPRPLAFTALAVVLPVAGARAQSPADSVAQPAASVVADTTRLPGDSVLLAGQFVRGRRADGSSFHGIVRSVHGDTLELRAVGPDGTPLRVGASGLRRLEVRRDRPSLQRNLLIGGAIGAVGGGLVFLNACDKHQNLCVQQTSCDEDGDGYEDEQCPSYDLATVSVLGGALVGGLLAYVVTPSAWRRVGASIGVSLAPSPRGGLAAAAGARIPFAALVGRR